MEISTAMYLVGIAYWILHCLPFKAKEANSAFVTSQIWLVGGIIVYMLQHPHH